MISFLGCVVERIDDFIFGMRRRTNEFCTKLIQILYKNYTKFGTPSERSSQRLCIIFVQNLHKFCTKLLQILYKICTKLGTPSGRPSNRHYTNFKQNLYNFCTKFVQNSERPRSALQNASVQILYKICTSEEKKNKLNSSYKTL